eukprot:14525044-Alexandrium_andersonii.AAC.1
MLGGQWLRNRWKRAGSRWKLLEVAGSFWKQLEAVFAPRRWPSAAARPDATLLSSMLGPIIRNI